MRTLTETELQAVAGGVLPIPGTPLLPISQLASEVHDYNQLFLADYQHDNDS